MKKKYILVKFSEMMSICNVLKDLDYACRTMQYPFDDQESQGKLALLISVLENLIYRYFGY